MTSSCSEMKIERVALLLWLAATSVFLAACGAESLSPRNTGKHASFADSDLPNILLVTLDTTRQDRLGMYGYARPTSPNLDRLAEEALVFTHAYSTSSWTMPAHASLFTGKFPSSHGARYDPNGSLDLTKGIDGPDTWPEIRARGISVDETTLALLLQEKGYDTGAIVGGPWLKKVFGLDKGFAHFDDRDIDSVNGRTADLVSTAAVAWIKQPRENPFFLFLNYYDPHGPYAPPTELVPLFLPEDFAENRVSEGVAYQIQLNAYYDAEIRFMDNQLGRLLGFLKEARLYDDTWIIITADHGELLGERGLDGHGASLTQEEIRIPLIIKYPKGTGERGVSPQPVQLTDILPMIAHALDISAPAEIQGQAPWEINHPIVAEVYPLPVLGGDDSQALIDGSYKYVWSSNKGPQLYDLSTPEPESSNLLEEQGPKAKSLRTRLRSYRDSWSEPGRSPEGGTVDAETLEALKNLGYVE
jgi:arylsulfatase A-like enzyme